MTAGASDVIRSLLDEILHAWKDAGIDLGPGFIPAPPAPAVREELSGLGFEPTAELVALYAWRAPLDLAGLFWEADLVGLDAAIAAWTRFRAGVADEPVSQHGAGGGPAWPGPPSWFPALVGIGVESDCLMLDNSSGPDRGSLWWVMPQDSSSRVFDSLTEALAAAVSCVKDGWWHHRAGIVECPRTHQPWSVARPGPSAVVRPAPLTPSGRPPP